VEVEDICDVDPLLRAGAFAANGELASASDESVEIELTSEQIDALLRGTIAP
jgi:hypothetical protein